MLLSHHPRRSLRQQGIELTSTVGLETRRHGRNTITDAVNENDHQDQLNVPHVLDSDLAEEEEEIEQPPPNVQHPTEEIRTKEAETKKRKTRGPTRLTKVAKHIQDHQDQLNDHQDQLNVAHVLGSDLAEEEEEFEQPPPREMDAERDVQGATEVNVQHPTEEIRTKEAETKKRKTREPTRLSKVAKHIQEKIEVEFTSTGEHVGPGSVTLSSFIGLLVRETRDHLWEEIQVI